MRVKMVCKQRGSSWIKNRVSFINLASDIFHPSKQRNCWWKDAWFLTRSCRWSFIDQKLLLLILIYAGFSFWTLHKRKTITSLWTSFCFKYLELMFPKCKNKPKRKSLQNVLCSWNFCFIYSPWKFCCLGLYNESYLAVSLGKEVFVCQINSSLITSMPQARSKKHMKPYIQHRLM